MEPPPEVDDDMMRREEEELQRALELSVQDKGGQSKWSDYTLTSGAAGSNQGKPPSQPYRAPPAESGYVPASAVPPQLHIQTNTAPAQQTPSKDLVSPANPAPSVLVTRVRALHSFEPTETGELAFERGDIIRVVDRGYKDWWRGQLRGRTGIFPVNYVVSGLLARSPNVFGTDRLIRNRCPNQPRLSCLEKWNKRPQCSLKRRTLTSC